MTLVLLGLAVAMAAAVGILVVANTDKSPGKDGGRENSAAGDHATGGVGNRRRQGDGGDRQELPTGPRIEDLKLEPPVVYCIGASSGRAFNYALGKTLESIETLSPGQKFEMVVCYEDSLKRLSGNYVTAGPDAPTEVRKFCDDLVAGSASRIAEGVQAAAAMQPRPRTLVIFAHSAVPDADVDKVASAADAAGAKVITVILTDEKTVVEQLKELSEKPKAKGKWIVHGEKDFR